MAFDRTVSALRRRARLLMIAGLFVMVVAALDPLEASIIVVLGGGLVAFGARLRGSSHVVYLYACLVMLVVGVAALWGLSAIGGFGGTSGRSYFWGLLIVPYPVGWLAGLVGGVRALGEPGRVA
jgi:hypothetical protein